ncbi:hypothetical protein GF340_01055 [Candidatus Peregrinibacteria bacterium]|nr:hypothetical protein [Candidatus Peregrinibacteria bacterium]
MKLKTKTKIILKNVLQSVIMLSVMVVALTCIFPNEVFAQLFPLPDSTQYGDNIAQPQGATAQAQFASLTFNIIQNVRYIIGAIAILMIVYAGFRMVTGWGQEDVYDQQRQSILWAGVGLVIVAMAGELTNVFQVTCPEPVPGAANAPCIAEGGFLKDPNAIIRTAVLFDQRTQIIMTFIKYLIGGVAVVQIVISGFRLITMGAKEEKIETDKKKLIYAGGGLFLIIIAETMIKRVLYKVDLSRYPSTGGPEPAIDAVRGVQEIVGFTNFIVSIVGPIAVLALLGGGVYYLTSGGNEEQQSKAKRIIFAALVGIILIYGAFAIVNTIIVGRF